MKKILLFSTLFIILLLTGCSNNGNKLGDIDLPINEDIDNGVRLVCSRKVQTVDVDMIADFKEDTLTYLGLQYEMDLSAYTDAQISAVGAQDMCTTVKKSMSTYTDAFTNCKQKVENKVLVITADFDLTKLAGADLTTNTNLTDAKTGLEKQGYSCIEEKK